MWHACWFQIGWFGYLTNCWSTGILPVAQPSRGLAVNSLSWKKWFLVKEQALRMSADQTGRRPSEGNSNSNNRWLQPTRHQIIITDGTTTLAVSRATSFETWHQQGVPNKMGSECSPSFCLHFFCRFLIVFQSVTVNSSYPAFFLYANPRESKCDQSTVGRLSNCCHPSSLQLFLWQWVDRSALTGAGHFCAFNRM